MPAGAALSRSPLFEGLTPAELDAVAERMTARRFAAGEQLCRAGDAPDLVWVITGGLVHWLAPTSDGAGELVARMRKGEVIGAQDVITGSERLATVVASIPTQTLEVAAAELIELAQRFPQILINLVRLQRERLFRANARSAEKERGEEIALVTGPSLVGAVSRIVAAARSASPRPLTFLDRRLSFAGALTAADDLVSEHATVLIPAELDPETLAPLLEEVDRVVALAGSAPEAERLGRLSGAAQLARLEVVLVGEEALAASRAWPAQFEVRVVRTCPRDVGFPLADADLGWLARHLTRTKLGLALGAGGVKGYAHVGALQVLEEAGYTVDYVGGSSIGGFVATHVGLGYDSAEIDARFRAAFNPETVSSMFASAFGGGTKSAEVLSEMLQRVTEGRSFADAVIPLVIMAVDLTDRAPAPLRDGPLWEALMATLAVAGVFPPRDRDGHRMVDGLHLVPVPTGSVIEDGADIVVSVNLMGAQTLDHWPSGPTPQAAAPARKGRYNALDTMLEVMDLSQVDTSERHADLADVVITPRFGPADWRDFHLGDLFLAAGRAGALAQLPNLQAISRPVDLTAPADGFARSDSLIV
ncbi:MAG: patatin-like phospholipase family protein [Actinobacteria bacterium]|nr:patatin-like phospholipase family protein [Actinomycetota bacterium]